MTKVHSTPPALNFPHKLVYSQEIMRISTGRTISSSMCSENKVPPWVGTRPDPEDARAISINPHKYETVNLLFSNSQVIEL